jgi:hypothetical protein
MLWHLERLHHPAERRMLQVLDLDPAVASPTAIKAVTVFGRSINAAMIAALMHEQGEGRQQDGHCAEAKHCNSKSDV